MHTMYQPKNRTFVPSAHVGRSLNSTRFDGTGPDIVEDAESGGN
jgi:hypothetical protein